MPDVGSVKYKVELDNSSLDNEVSKTESELSSKLDKIGSTVGKQFGYSILKDVGGAFVQLGEKAVGFISDSIQTGMSFDKAMSQVAATMGVTTDEIGELRDFAQEMGATTAFSANEAAQALNYMALAGYDAETAMSMLPTVLDLAAAGDIELARASDMVTDAQSALGLSLEETSTMVDQMAKASSKSNTSVEQLGDAILTVGGTAKSLAGGTTELSTALGIMADSGIKGAEAGTHMRNILLALNPTTKDAKEAFEELGINAYDANGDLRPLNDTFSEMAVRLADFDSQGRTEILSKMFNKTDLAAADALLTAATYDMDGLKEAVGQLGINWEGVRVITKDWGLSAEEGMEHIIRTTENWILSGSTMEQTLGLLRDSYGMTQEDAVALFETVSAELDEQGNRWTELTGYIEDADGAAKQMAETQLDNLAGSITLFQSALEGAQIVISDMVTPALTFLVDAGTDALSRLTQAAQEGGFKGAMQELGTIVSETVAEIQAKAPEMLAAGTELITNLISGIIERAPELLAQGTEMIVNFVTGILEGLPSVIEAAGEIIVNILDQLLSGEPQMMEEGTNLLMKLAEAFINNIPQIIQAIVQVLAAIVQTILEHLPEIYQKGVELIGKVVAGMISMIPQVLSGTMDIINGIRNSFNLDWGSIGSNIVSGIANGISAGLSWVVDAAKSVAEAALGAAKGFLGISSPSKAMRDQVGKWIPAGLAEGIDENADVVDESMEDLSRSLTTSVDYDLPDFAGLADKLGVAINASTSQQLNIPLIVDGREIARATAVYTNEQLAWEAR